MDELVRQCTTFILDHLTEVCSLQHDLASLPPELFAQLAKAGAHGGGAPSISIPSMRHASGFDAWELLVTPVWLRCLASCVRCTWGEPSISMPIMRRNPAASSLYHEMGGSDAHSTVATQSHGLSRLSCISRGGVYPAAASWPAKTPPCTADACIPQGVSSCMAFCHPAHT